MSKHSEPHPICKQLRDLRYARRESLDQASKRIGLSAVAIGSYERGERQPPLPRLEQVFNAYGYTIVAVPKDFDATRLTGNMIRELRQIANQLEEREQTEKAKQEGSSERVSA